MPRDDIGHEAQVILTEFLRSNGHLFGVAKIEQGSFDLRDFVDRLATTATDPALLTACENLRGALDKALVHSVALGPSVTRAHGLAFWFPGSIGTYQRDIHTYRRLAFAERTGWADYLTAQLDS